MEENKLNEYDKLLGKTFKCKECGKECYTDEYIFSDEKCSRHSFK